MYDYEPPRRQEPGRQPESPWAKLFVLVIVIFSTVMITLCLKDCGSPPPPPPPPPPTTGGTGGVLPATGGVPSATGGTTTDAATDASGDGPVAVTDGGPDSIYACRSGIPRLNPSNYTVVAKDEGGEAALYVPKTGKSVGTERLRAFEDQLSGFVHILTMMGDDQDGSSVVSEGLQARLAEAKRLVLGVKMPPCAWKWKEVAGLVSSEGAKVLVRELADYHPLHGGVADDDWHYHSLLVRSSWYPAKELEGASVVHLAGLLVMRATLRVAVNSASAYSRMNQMELDTALIQCTSFRSFWPSLLRGLGNWNQGRLLALLADGGALVSDRGDKELLDDLRNFDRGDAEGFISSLFGIMHELNRRFEEFAKMDPKVDCEYPPMIRGAKRGVEFYPPDMDDPTINLIMAEMYKAARVVMR